MSESAATSGDTEGPDTSGTAIAQGDLAVNLFAVLLVVLSTLTIAVVSVSSDGYVTDIKRAEISPHVGPPFLGWKAVLPTYPKLVLRGGEVYLLDLTALSEVFALGSAMEFGPAAYDSSRMVDGDLDPSAFRVFIRLYGSEIPQSLVSDSLSLADVNADAGAEFISKLGQYPKIDLFVFPKELNTVSPLIEAFHQRYIDLRLVVMSRDDHFGFVQSGRDYGLERSFK